MKKLTVLFENGAVLVHVAPLLAVVDFQKSFNNRGDVVGIYVTDVDSTAGKAQLVHTAQEWIAYGLFLTEHPDMDPVGSKRTVASMYHNQLMATGAY